MIYICKECSYEYAYWDVAVSLEKSTIKKKYNCPSCNVEISTRNLNRSYETIYDELLGKTIKLWKQEAVRANCLSLDRKKFGFNIDKDERKGYQNFSINDLAKKRFPTIPLIKGDRWKRDAFDDKGVSHVHHFYTNRAIDVIAEIIEAIENSGFSHAQKRICYFVVTSFFDRNATKRNRFIINKHNPRGRINGPMANCLYLPNLFCEVNIVNLFLDKLKDINKANTFTPIGKDSYVLGQCSSSSDLRYVLDNSIDYIFTDPPFGHNIQYSELNVPLESLLRVFSNNKEDCVVNSVSNKDFIYYTKNIKGFL